MSTGKRSGLCLLIVALAAGLTLAMAGKVFAAGWVVTKAADTNDGACTPADCSLREAIAAASDGDSITFDGDYAIYLSSTLSINKRLTIDGSGRAITVSGDTNNDSIPDVRVFSIGTSGVVTLSHLAILRGVGNNGGGIYNSGRLNVQDCLLSFNQANRYYYGGGIYNRGMLTVTNTIFSGNSASYGGGISGYNDTLTVQGCTFSGNSAYYGGGILGQGTLIVQGSTFSGNTATTYGGGIENSVTLTVTNTTFSGNNAPLGGGIYNRGVLTVQSSTVFGNSADRYGGGIRNFDGTLHLRNTIIANNTRGDCAGKTMTALHNLIEDAANACGLIDGSDGNIIGVDPALGTLMGSPAYLPLLSGSPALDAGDNAACPSTDQRGVARPQDGDGDGAPVCDIGSVEAYNDIAINDVSLPEGDSGAAAFRFTLTRLAPDGASSIQWATADGAAIQPEDYTSASGTLNFAAGEITRTITVTVQGDTASEPDEIFYVTLSNPTHATVVRSPGVGIIQTDDPVQLNVTTSGSGAVTSTPPGINCGSDCSETYAYGTVVTLTAAPGAGSIFAYWSGDVAGRANPLVLTMEASAVKTVTAVFCGRVIVTNINDSGAGSLRQAIDDACDGGAITFDAGLSGSTIRVASALSITKNLIISSTVPITVSGGNVVRVFGIAAGVNVTLERLAIIDGYSARGGGIHNSGVLTITNVTLSGNSADYGSGIYNSGTLTVLGSVLSGNSADYGSGIYNSGTLTVQNSIFSANSADYGGGIYSEPGTLTIQSSTFSNNSADFGGGIRNNHTMLTVRDSTFSGNSARRDGGGIYNEFGTLTAQNSTFSGNSATDDGGGIYNDIDTLIMQGCTLSANRAASGGGIHNYDGILHLRNTIIANSASGGDCTGEAMVAHYNLIENAANACGLTDGVNGNLIGPDPVLGTLVGSPAYLPLLASSPAIDAGDKATCLPTDQRGAARPQDGDRDGTAICDIGAYEALPYDLSVAKSVTPESRAAYHGVVTYTVTLSNMGLLSDTAVFLTDTLPAQVDFGQWIERNGATFNGNVITWTGTVTAGSQIAFSFTATHTGEYGEVVSNTVEFSGTTQTGQDVAVFTVQAGYTLSVGLVGAGAVASQPAGITCGGDCGEVFVEGTVVTLTATPTTGWRFAGWSGDLGGAANPAHLTLDGDKAVTATFSILTHTLDVTLVGSGTVSADPDLAYYTHGDIVTLTATPTTGWRFVGWSGDLDGEDNPNTITMDGNKVVTATFTTLPVVTYTLEVHITPAGSGAVTRTPDASSYVSGTVVTLTAVPEAGWSFAGWSGNLGGADNPDTITMDSNKVVTATFTTLPAVTYTLDVHITPAGSGAVTRTPDASSYVSGTVVTLTAVPEAGWLFAGWSGDLGGADNPAHLTMDGDKAVTATFTLVTYTLDVHVAGNGEVMQVMGTLVLPPGHVYAEGTVVTLTAVPAMGWYFGGWSGDLGGADNPDTITMDANKVITATFTTLPVVTYTLDVHITPAGSGAVTRTPDASSYVSGTVVTLTAVPEMGWLFAGWSGDLGGADNPDTITMDGNKVVTATFTQALPTPLTSVIIAGASTGAPGVYTFTTSYLPANATLPITYTWDDGGTAATSVRTLGQGAHILVVTVTNPAGTAVTSTHTIVIALESCIAITGADFDWMPLEVIVGEMMTFNGTYTPTNAALPVTCTWMLNGSFVGNGPVLTHTFVVPAQRYTVTLTVDNACPNPAVVVEKHVTVWPRRLYLPILAKGF